MTSRLSDGLDQVGSCGLPTGSPGFCEDFARNGATSAYTF
ncbi:hypothetical protein THTE_3967 [Thermogutta terrifontis]|uniref:Uncharacterized protein n=1 Tax=Thermogutta terrifontis TaxID=1331910 RepID=A0A286RKV2_9BACT|nr:hypothetical protein THTE_3967 [Thermogutta terrifontis]